MQLITVDQVVKKDGMNMIHDLVYRETSVRLTDHITGGRERVNRHGKLSKRIKRNLRRDFDIVLTDKTVEEIGNIMANHSLGSREYLVEFTDDFRGTIGQYGDGGSCFQEGNGYHSNLIRMEKSDCFSVFRVEKPESDEYPNGRKLARAWAFTAPDPDGGIVLFNSYGLWLDKTAILAGKLLDLDPRPVDFYTDWIAVNDRTCYALGGESDTYRPDILYDWVDRNDPGNMY